MGVQDEFSRWARFGVDQDGIKYIPVGGVCIMAYLCDIKDNSILLGILDGDGYAEFLHREWAIYTEREEIWRNKWFIPSGFLHFGEPPLQCAKRLVSKMLNGDVERLELYDVISFTQPSKYYPGYYHWHLCYIYKPYGLKITKMPWFKELTYVPLDSLTSKDIGVAGGPVLKILGLVKE